MECHKSDVAADSAPRHAELSGTPFGTLLLSSDSDSCCRGTVVVEQRLQFSAAEQSVEHDDDGVVVADDSVADERCSSGYCFGYDSYADRMVGVAVVGGIETR